jgi:diaminohydroxyphosphoribosylaminopyrimidine deaminase/5-amino-6-(5-phosphoribosylamino)uracil reductase
MVDPNPLVSGRGIRRLRRAGIKVRVGLLQEQCRKLNEAFSKYITRRIPFVILKLAASLDGKISTSTGDSRWITGPAARRYVHRLRNQVDAVLVGAGTVLADDPRLTCRIPGGRDPWRIVLAGRLRIPLTARLLHERHPKKTIVVTGTRAPLRKVRAIERCGAEVWRFPLRAGEVSFASLLRELGKRGILSVMIEGGATTAARALREKVVDKVCLFYAPKIIGGDGLDMVEALGIKKTSLSRQIKNLAAEKLGKDLLVTGYL